MAASTSATWRLSWKRFWRASSRLTHQVRRLYIIISTTYVITSFIICHLSTPLYFLCRDGFGAEAHGILQSLQQCSGFAQRSGRLNRRGTCCSCHYLARQEGEGFAHSASSDGLLSLSCICAAYDAHHGGLHHSVLQPWWAPKKFTFLPVSSCVIL